MPDFLLSIVNNSLWAKGLAALVLLVYLRKIGERPEIAVLAHFRTLALVLLATDAVLFFVPWLWVLPVVQGLAVLFLHHRILAASSPAAQVSPWFWVVGALAVALGIVAAVLGWPQWVGVAGPAALLTLWISFAVRLNSISEFNTDGATVVLAYRGSLVGVMVALQVTALLLSPWGGYLNPAVQMLAFPLAHLVHTWTLSFWERFVENERNRHLVTLEKNLGSLFEFMIAIGNAISEKLEMDKVLDFVVKSAVKSTNADGGAVFLVDEFEDVLKVKAIDGDFPPPYQVHPRLNCASRTWRTISSRPPSPSTRP